MLPEPAELRLDGGTALPGWSGAGLCRAVSVCGRAVAAASRCTGSGRTRFARLDHRFPAARLAAGTQPIPDALREALAGYFDRALLEQVRYRVGDPNPTSLSHGVLQNPDINAITLIDVVIFRHAHEAEQDVALWAHELLHVQQYLELGVEGFAARYLSDPDSLERPAYALQNSCAWRSGGAAGSCSRPLRIGQSARWSPLAAIGQLAQGVAQAAQFGDALLQVGDMLQGQGLDLGAAALLVLPQAEQLTDFLQGEKPMSRACLMKLEPA